MNKNTIIGILLIFGLMIGYSVMMTPSKEELEAAKRKQDSTYAAENLARESAKTTTLDTLQNTQSQPVAQQVQSNDTTAQDVALTEAFGEFAGAAKGEDGNFIVETDLVKITFLNKGGRIGQVELKDYKTFEGKPLILFNPDSSQFNVAFFAGVRPINTQDLYFVPVVNSGKGDDKNQIAISGNDSIKVAMRLYAGNLDSTGASDKYIEYLYTINADNYMIDYKINFVNMQDIIASNNRDINIDWVVNLIRQEKSKENEKTTTSIYYRHSDEEVDNLSERKDDDANISTSLKWISFKQQFFSSTFIAGGYFENVKLAKSSLGEKENKYLETMTSSVSIPFNNRTDQTLDFSFYFGPNKYNILRKYKLDLEKQIPLGWGFFLMQWINRFAVIPVFNFLEGFNLNYGIIILVLTILLKLVLFPIAYKTYLSSAKMRLLKPEIEEINSKFTKKDDALKKQQATMALYKKAGVNPMAGCVPMLLQLPILLAMFRFFPASIELRQEAFLWANDLSSYDSVLDLPFTIPFYGDHVSLFTLLMTVSTIIYTKLNNDMMSTGNQMPGMKTMMYLMPVMFLGFFNSYSSGLSYYYLLANLITFAQMFAIRRVVNEDKLHAQIQENKKKPVKKSNFQKKLEDMAKQQQQKRR